MIVDLIDKDSSLSKAVKTYSVHTFNFGDFCKLEYIIDTA